MFFSAIIVAAGSGSRMGGERNKIFEKICGVPIILRTVITFLNAREVNEIVIVCRENDMEELRSLLSVFSDGRKTVKYAVGGKTRQESVSNGVEAAYNADYLVIHDAARPLVSLESISAVCTNAMKYGASSLAVPLKDTIKETDESGFVINTPRRESFMSVQTPQVIERELYKGASKKARADDMDFTDDCSMVEYFGSPVFLTKGDYKNIKITTPEDLKIAEAFIGGES